MNLLPATFVLLLALTSFAFGQDSPESFLSAFRTALVEKNPAKLEALTHTTGMSDADRVLNSRMRNMMLTGGEIESLTFAPLPADFQSIIVQRGKKIEPTQQPTGLIVVKFRSPDGSTMTTPYAIVEDRHVLIGSKITELDWKGPPDKTIGYAITGSGQDDLRITVKWNASGVTLEQPFAAPSLSFVGQYIEEMTVTSENEGTEVNLTVLEDGQPVFISEPLKGKGRLAYKRP